MLSSSVSRLKLTPRCMSLKIVDSGSRLKAGSTESLELLYPSTVIGLWVLCCLFVWFICMGGVSYCICACTWRTVAGIISPVLYTLLIPRPGLSLARDLPVWLCWLTNKLQGACLPLYGEYAFECGYFSWLLGILLLVLTTTLLDEPCPHACFGFSIMFPPPHFQRPTDSLKCFVTWEEGEAADPFLYLGYTKQWYQPSSHAILTNPATAKVRGHCRVCYLC